MLSRDHRVLFNDLCILARSGPNRGSALACLLRPRMRRLASSRANVSQWPFIRRRKDHRPRCGLVVA